MFYFTLIPVFVIPWTIEKSTEIISGLNCFVTFSRVLNMWEYRAIPFPRIRNPAFFPIPDSLTFGEV